MRTTQSRGWYDRSKLRDPFDLTDAEWALIKPLIPAAKRGGNKRTVDVREIVNGLMHVLGTGCQWAALPKDLPARSTVSRYFLRWTNDRTLARLHHALYVACREQAGREAGPAVGIVTRAGHRQPERQERGKGGISDPPGDDAGKKVRGRKRHVPVDTQGLLMQAIVHAADIEDRDGGVLLMASLSGLYPFLLRLYADGGYAGPKFRDGSARVCRQVRVEILRRSDASGFVVLPRRWIVERTLAWLNRCRRPARDRERMNRNALAFLQGASIRVMVRKLRQDSI